MSSVQWLYVQWERKNYQSLLIPHGIFFFFFTVYLEFIWSPTTQIFWNSILFFSFDIYEFKIIKAFKFQYLSVLGFSGLKIMLKQLNLHIWNNNNNIWFSGVWSYIDHILIIIKPLKERNPDTYATCMNLGTTVPSDTRHSSRANTLWVHSYKVI